MIIHEDIEQGSEEWHGKRAGKITGTKAKAILGAKSKKDGSLIITDGANTVIQEKIIELVLGKVQETKQTEEMARGTRLEPESRALYEFKKDVEVLEVGFIEVSEYSGFSPDGLVGEDGLWENKSMNAANHLRAVLFNYVKPDHLYQCQKGLGDSNRKWCDYTVYNPDVDPSLQFHTIRIYRDEEVIEKINQAVSIASRLIEEGYKKYLAIKQNNTTTEGEN